MNEASMRQRRPRNRPMGNWTAAQLTVTRRRRRRIAMGPNGFPGSLITHHWRPASLWGDFTGAGVGGNAFAVNAESSISAPQDDHQAGEANEIS